MPPAENAQLTAGFVHFEAVVGTLPPADVPLRPVVQQVRRLVEPHIQLLADHLRLDPGQDGAERRGPRPVQAGHNEPGLGDAVHLAQAYPVPAEELLVDLDRQPLAAGDGQPQRGQRAPVRRSGQEFVVRRNAVERHRLGLPREAQHLGRCRRGRQHHRGADVQRVQHPGDQAHRVHDGVEHHQALTGAGQFVERGVPVELGEQGLGGAADHLGPAGGAGAELDEASPRRGGHPGRPAPDAVRDVHLEPGGRSAVVVRIDHELSTRRRSCAPANS